MAKAHTINIDVHGFGKIDGEAVEVGSTIYANVSVTTEGDCVFFGENGLEARCSREIQKALDTQLTVKVSFDTINCGGDVTL